jgi:hypothetical protein
MLGNLPSEGIAGNDYKFELEPYDVYGNRILTLRED